MREYLKLKARASVRSRVVLPRPGTPSSRTCPPASKHIRTPSTTLCCPTMIFAISSRTWFSLATAGLAAASIGMRLILVDDAGVSYYRAKNASLKRVARGDAAGFQTGAEPVDPLRGCAMGERFGIRVALSHSLQTVVAHRRRGAQRGIDIGPVDEVPLPRGVSPDTRKAIGLQFQLHRKRIPLTWLLLLQTPHFRLYSEKLLHMVADLVRDHVSLCKVSGRPEAPLQFGEKAEIEVDLLIARTVER